MTAINGPQICQESIPHIMSYHLNTSAKSQSRLHLSNYPILVSLCPQQLQPFCLCNLRTKKCIISQHLNTSLTPLSPRSFISRLNLISILPVPGSAASPFCSQLLTQVRSRVDCGWPILLSRWTINASYKYRYLLIAGNFLYCIAVMLKLMFF